MIIILKNTKFGNTTDDYYNFIGNIKIDMLQKTNLLRYQINSY